MVEIAQIYRPWDRKPTGKRFGALVLTDLLLLSLLVAFVSTASAGAQTAGTFTPTGNMTTPRFFHTATLLTDGRVLIAGGDLIVGMGRNLGLGLSMMTLSSAEIYDPRTG